MKRTKTQLVGRDPSMGRLSFKTGVTKTRKDRKRNRKDKYAKRELRQQLRGD